MKSVLVCCVLISISSASLTEDGQAKILSYDSQNDGPGNYEFSFETSNGIKRTEKGTLVNIGQPDEHLQVQGTYSYTNPEGKFVMVRYYADENGYHAYDGLTKPVPASLSGSVVATLLG